MKRLLHSRSIPSSRNILHRVLTVAAATLLGVTVLAAQRPQKRSTGPRALGLVQVAQNGRGRLIPVCILINGRFYDASAYRADPRPMALAPETVYEATRSGESVGLFTLTNAITVANNWYGLGQWKLNSAPEPEKNPAPVVAAPSAPEDDGRPVLHRPKAQEAPAPTSAPAPKPANDDDRPVLHKPTAQSAPEAAPKPADAKSAEKPAVQAEAKAAPAPKPAEDSDRPVLRRGKPAEKGAWDEVDPFTAPKAGTGQAAAAAKTAEPVETLAAVSDAAGPELRSYVMQLSSEERQKYEARVRTDLYEAVRKFAATRPQHKPAPLSELRDVQFKVLDVQHNNEPVLVMTATLPELAQTGTSNFHYFVTEVARFDMYGDLHRLFAQVTDSTHLDAYPRMELIDAVDAQGTGTGQLLFRSVGDGDFRYSLYRVGSDQLWPLFESASQSF